MTVQYYGHKQVSKELFRQQLIDSPPPVIAIDTETISLKEKIPIGFSIATSPEEAWWFDTYPEMDKEVELLKSLMTNPNITKVYANVMFDIKAQGLIFNDFKFDTRNIADILVIARLLGRVRASVGTLAIEVGQSAQNAGDLMREYRKNSMLELPHELVASKCANDAMVTLSLYYHLIPQVETLSGLAPDYLEKESRVIPILIDMSLRGLAVDQERRGLLEKKFEEERDYYKSVCSEHDFNPGSGMQAGFVLAKRGNFLPFTHSKKQYKTDEDTLEFVDDPLVQVILGYKRATSILSKYLYPLREVDRLYTEYGLDTEVNRTKSSNFNMQNIPSETSRVKIDCRQIFVPDNGIFTSGDFSQEHLRILMYYSGDRQMKRVYEDGEMGGDIHNFFASKRHLPRALAKIVNYAIPYGGSPEVVRAQTKIRDLRKCSEYIDDWADTFPEAWGWIRSAKEYGMRHRKSLPTLFGRQITIPDEFDRRGRLNTEGMERKCCNYPILGSDGEVMKRALIICDEAKLPLAVQVHDSITCDGDIKFPVAKLEDLSPVHIPFVIEQSERWK